MVRQTLSATSTVEAFLLNFWVGEYGTDWACIGRPVAEARVIAKLSFLQRETERRQREEEKLERKASVEELFVTLKSESRLYFFNGERDGKGRERRGRVGNPKRNKEVRKRKSVDQKIA